MSCLPGDDVFVVIRETLGSKPLARPLGYSSSYDSALKLLETAAVKELYGNDYKPEVMGDPLYNPNSGDPEPHQAYLAWLELGDVNDLYTRDVIGGFPLNGIASVEPKNAGIGIGTKEAEEEDYAEEQSDSTKIDAKVNAEPNNATAVESKLVASDVEASHSAVDLTSAVSTEPKTIKVDSSVDSFAMEQPKPLKDVLNGDRSVDTENLSGEEYEDVDEEEEEKKAVEEYLASKVYILPDEVNGRKITTRYMVYRIHPTPDDYEESFTEGDQTLLRMGKEGKLKLPAEYVKDAARKMEKAARRDALPGPEEEDGTDEEEGMEEELTTEGGPPYDVKE